MTILSRYLFLLLVCNRLSAMETYNTRYTHSQWGKTIEVPATVIRQRLCEMQLHYFFGDMDKKIGDRPLYPVGFVMAVNNEIALYLNDMHKKGVNSEWLANNVNFMTKMRPLMIRSILKDHPTAIETLSHEGFLEWQPTNKLQNIHWKTFIENK